MVRQGENMQNERQLKQIAAQLRYYSYRMDENPRGLRIHAAMALEMENLIKQYKDLIFSDGAKNVTE